MVDIHRKTKAVEGVTAFFDAIKQFTEAYPIATFSYVAVLKGQQIHIARARLQFEPLESPPPERQFSAGSIPTHLPTY